MPPSATLIGMPDSAQLVTRSNDGPTIRITCPSFFRHRYASIARQYSSAVMGGPGAVLLVSLPDHAQPVKRQVTVDGFDRRGLGRDQLGQSARRDARGRRVQLA